MGKAWGTLGMGFGGREFARRVASGNTAFIQALTVASGGRIVPVPGGVLIRDAAGEDAELRAMRVVERNAAERPSEARPEIEPLVIRQQRAGDHGRPRRSLEL